MTVEKNNPTTGVEDENVASLTVPASEADTEIETAAQVNTIAASLVENEPEASATPAPEAPASASAHSDVFADIDVVEYRIIQERLARSRKVRALLDIAAMLGYGGSFGTNLIVRDKHDRNRVEVNDDVEAVLVRLYDQLADLPTVKTVEHLDYRLNVDGTVPVTLRLARAQKVSSLLEIAAFMGHNKNSKLFIKDANKDHVLNEEVATDLVRVYDELADLPTKITGDVDGAEVAEVLDVEVATE